MDVKKLITEQKDYIVEVRRHLHENPEVGLKEFETIKYIEGQLDAMGIAHKYVQNGGIIAEITCQKPGKTLLIRADMDALPMQETDDNLKGPRVCKSKKDGAMHACGHDGHVAMLLAAAKVIEANKSELKGKYILIFEQAEEIFGGIAALAKELDANYKYDGAWVIHLKASMKSGTISVDAGPRMSGPFTFDVTITGKGGHGSRPDLANNPLDTFCDISASLKEKVAVRANPFYPVTLCVGAITFGTVGNIIPDDLTFKGTLRILDWDKVGEYWTRELMKTFEDCCNKHGTTFKTNMYFPRDMAVVNNPVASRIAEGSIRKILGDAGVASCEPWMASECMALYNKRAPGLLVFVGIANEAVGSGADHHNVYFDIDEEALVGGAAVTLQYALDFMDFEGSFEFTPDNTPIEELMSGKKWLKLAGLAK
ncbi:N-acetyldiaminopimelate deacetylase [bioreactor metagenome]|uniref:N-acetyldiaminopimelate deacetylase n=1 Tax=bioreactor metagenome TaxID=1076179 RepID=A0A644YIY9_9ZZZZ